MSVYEGAKTRIREVVLGELLYADLLVLMSETIGGLRNMFLNGRRLLCLQCVKWSHGICAGVKRMTPKL